MSSSSSSSSSLPLVFASLAGKKNEDHKADDKFEKILAGVENHNARDNVGLLEPFVYISELPGKDIRGKDYDHKTKRFTSIKNNRGNRGKGTKKEK